MIGYLDSDAQFSPDHRHRLWLMRQWEASLPSMVSLSINPSTADGNTDDHTITKDVGFAKRWGFGSLWKINLFTRIATDSKELMPVPRNEWNVEDADRVIAVTVRGAGRIVIAYGRFQHIKAAVEERAFQVRRILKAEATCPIGTFGANKDGSPRHPLMIPYSTPFVEMEL